SQVMDEARHVEVYSRYLREKLTRAYPINRHLKTLLDQILTDGRWDMKYLGMQIMVEGLAMAAFGYMHKLCREPLLTELTHYVMKDESRHVAFGVLSLADFFTQLSPSERRDREEFLAEGCRLMRDRLLMEDVWEEMGWRGGRGTPDRARVAADEGVPEDALREDRSEREASRAPHPVRP